MVIGKVIQFLLKNDNKKVLGLGRNVFNDLEICNKNILWQHFDELYHHFLI